MKNITAIVIIVVTVGLIGYDIFAGIKGGTEATISARIWAWSQTWPAIPFAFGYLMGHLFPFDGIFRGDSDG